MISVVIRNKNEAPALRKLLTLLNEKYSDDIGEVILVDNQSSDTSPELAASYGAVLVNISHFTYGSAINLGIEKAQYPYIVLLSSHAYPIEEDFFKDSIAYFEKHPNLAGVRYRNAYEKTPVNPLHQAVIDPLKYGMMNACSMLRRDVWEKCPFDEKIMFSEDKLWSKLVTQMGYQIHQLDLSFHYEIKRTVQGNLNRWKNETLAYYIIHETPPPSYIKSIARCIKKIILDITQGKMRLAHHYQILKYRLKLPFLIQQYHSNE